MKRLSSALRVHKNSDHLQTSKFMLNLFTQKKRCIPVIIAKKGLQRNGKNKVTQRQIIFENGKSRLTVLFWAVEERF